MKKYVIYTLMVLLFTGLTSCNEDEFFKIDRPQETQWTSTVTFDQGLSAAYFSVLYESHAFSIPLMIEFASSGIAHLLPETSTGAPWNEMNYRLFDRNFFATDVLWGAWYKAINMCNLAIALDQSNNGNPFGLKVDGSDYVDNYMRQVGEYYFLRAYAYYMLSRYFAPPYNHNGANTGKYIPFKTMPSNSKDEVFGESLGTNEEVYEQIISDLQAAKEKLPKAYNSATMLPTYQVGRANKYAASALLAKVYFVMGKYMEAKTELDFVIQAAEQEGRYALEEPIQAFNKNVITDIAKETIWEFNSGNSSSGFYSDFVYWLMITNLNFRDTDNGGRGANMVKSSWNQFTLSYWALDKMNWMTDPMNGDYTLTDKAANDLRFQQLYYYLREYKAGGDPLVYETVNSHTKVDKPQIYVDKAFRGSPGDGRYTKFPIIRLADLYLLRSWIKWKGNDPSGAAGDLNNVWNRAHPNSPDKYHAGNITHDAIFAEYLKEMTSEGWTLDFMVGTQMTIPAADEPTNHDVAPPYSEWHWAIPAAEKALNPDYQ